MKKKKSWDKKWYSDEFLNKLKQTEYTEMYGDLPVTVKYAPDAVSPLGIDPRLLGGPMGKTAKSMRLLPEFVIKRIKLKMTPKMLTSFRALCAKTSSAVCVRGGVDVTDSTVTADDGYKIPIRIYKNKIARIKTAVFILCTAERLSADVCLRMTRLGKSLYKNLICPL